MGASEIHAKYTGFKRFIMVASGEKRSVRIVILRGRHLLTGGARKVGSRRTLPPGDRVLNGECLGNMQIFTTARLLPVDHVLA